MRDELEARTLMRKKTQQLMELKFKCLQSSAKEMKMFDEFNYQQKRIEYWNYIRMSVHLLNFEIKLIK